MSQKKRGQTTIEYLLLLVAIVFIGIAVLNLIKERMVGDLDQCLKSGEGESLICSLSHFYDLQNFTYYNLPRARGARGASGASGASSTPSTGQGR